MSIWRGFPSSMSHSMLFEGSWKYDALDPVLSNFSLKYKVQNLAYNEEQVRRQGATLADPLLKRERLC